MENVIFVLQIMFAKVVTLSRQGRPDFNKIKLVLEKKVEFVKDGNVVSTRELWLFPSQIYDALRAMEINVMGINDVLLANYLAKAVIKFHLEFDEDGLYQNPVVDSVVLKDEDVDDIAFRNFLAVLSPNERIKILRKVSEAKAKKMKEATAKAREELKTVEATETVAEHVAETVAEPELTPRQIAARKAAETRRRNREAAAAQA